jgi:hypothetical protein
MGLAYYIVLEKQVDGLDTMMGGKMLARHLKSLDTVARKIGVRPLSEFLSMDKEAAMDVLGDDVPDIELPAVEQFPAEGGLETVRALLLRPEAQPALDDLQDCERILSVAAQHGVRWHLQVDF